MNIEEILALKDNAKIIEKICKDTVDRDIATWQDQYDGKHAILNRPDKIKGSGKNAIKVPVAKIVLTYQKKITDFRKAFLFGKPVIFKLNNKTPENQIAFDMILDILKKNKMDFFRRKLAEKVYIESHVAELWYITPDKEVKVLLLSYENGDLLYPHFNDYGDMDGFARKYKTTTVDDKTVEHVDLYTKDRFYYYSDKGQGYVSDEIPNLIGKIPVIYYPAPSKKPIWFPVQSSITTLESRESKHDDTNDYFGNPLLLLFGAPKAMPEKGEVGKLLQFDEVLIDGKTQHGGAEYLTWDESPESIKLQMESLRNNIFTLTSTANLGFDNIKGLGKVAAETVYFMLLDSIIACKNDEEIFGEGILREINLIKAIIGNIVDVVSGKNYVVKKDILDELDISIEFGNIIPKDAVNTIKSISQALGGEAFMSQESAVKANPMIENAEEEIKNLEAEKQEVKKLGESYEP